MYLSTRSYASDSSSPISISILSTEIARSITVVNDVVVGVKHPEDGHHPECGPTSAAAAAATFIARNMRAEVRNSIV